MSLYWDAPCMAIKPTKKPAGMNQDYWDARNRVSIDIHTFFKWINGEWDAKKTMGGYYRQLVCRDTNSCDPGCKDSCSCCQRSENTTHSATNYVSVTDGSVAGADDLGAGLRKNDCPKSDDTGPVPRYIKGTCDDFNSWPTQYGKIPEAELKKRRYNVCFPAQATAYYRTIYNRKDMGPKQVCGCPGAETPSAEEFQPDPPSSNTDSRTMQSSVCGQCECEEGAKAAIKCYYGSCRASFYSLTSISFNIAGSWYDPETKKVYPAINISGVYPGFGWLGDHPKDTPPRGPYGKHTTSTTVTVDGVTIPCGTSYTGYGYMGTITLGVTFTVKERAL